MKEKEPLIKLAGLGINPAATQKVYQKMEKRDRNSVIGISAPNKTLEYEESVAKKNPHADQFLKDMLKQISKIEGMNLVKDKRKYAKLLRKCMIEIMHTPKNNVERFNILKKKAIKYAAHLTGTR